MIKRRDPPTFMPDDALIPPFDYLARAEHEIKRRSAWR